MQSTAPSLLFISGWPACGETFYGEWLATGYDFRHVSLEAGRWDDSEWSGLWRETDTDQAVMLSSQLQEKHPRWVLTSPAPIEDLSRLEVMKAAGFSLWFLLARREELSRQRWLKLEREVDPNANPAAWKRLADAIRKSARGLRPHFRNQCIETLSGTGELLDGDELATRIGLAARP